MYRASLFLLLCLSIRVNLVSSACTVSKYEEAFGDRIKCTNSTVAAAVNQGGTIVGAILILQSRIGYIPDNSFVKYSKSLVSLNLHDCAIEDAGSNAFAGLTYLKKLSLPNNNLTRVREQWFAGLISLQQLDLSFNRIAAIEPSVFKRLPGLQRLDISENQLSCLEPTSLLSMPVLEKFRFSNNPMGFRCRGKLTLWLRDHGVNYKIDQRSKDGWLDDLLWQCSLEDPTVAESENLMRECVLTSVFNQLRTGLSTAESYPLSISQECTISRNRLNTCLVDNGHKAQMPPFSNGNVIRKLILHLHQAKSTF